MMANQTYKFSDLKQALKQGAPESVVNDIVANLSSTDINKALQTFNPGVEQTLVSALTPDMLQKVATSLDASTAANLTNLPPEFLAFAFPTYNDTTAFDHFTDVQGVFQATDINQNALTYDIAGSTATSVTLDNVTYDHAAVSDYGVLLLNSASGAYHFMADDAAINALTATTTATFNITVTDGANAPVSQAFNITLNGVNDAPVANGTVAGQATENGAASSLDALHNATDADAGQTLSVTNVPTNLPAGVTYDANTHSFSFDPSNAAYQHLADGAHTTVSLDYTVTDGQIAVQDHVSWDVTGVNEAPVVSAPVTGQATEHGDSVALNALANATDVDDGDQANLSVVLPDQLPTGVTYDANTHSFILDPKNAVFAPLNTGDQQTVTLNYGVTDGHGATTAASASWTVDGMTDAPPANVIHVGVSPDITDADVVVSGTPAKDYFVIDATHFNADGFNFVKISGFNASQDVLVFEHSPLTSSDVSEDPIGGGFWQNDQAAFSFYINPLFRDFIAEVVDNQGGRAIQVAVLNAVPNDNLFFDHNVQLVGGDFHLA
jgi:VCBS repeat-containing protein